MAGVQKAVFGGGKNSCNVFGGVGGKMHSKVEFGEVLWKHQRFIFFFKDALCTAKDAVSAVHYQCPGVLNFPSVWAEVQLMFWNPVVNFPAPLGRSGPLSDLRSLSDAPAVRRVV